jgi:oxygen-independent coproporphyrinogen-3 oxidase
VYSEKGEVRGEASVYVHVPFCAGLCDYCDFYSIPVRDGDYRIGLFIDTVIRDAEEQLRRFGIQRVPTVYIGGGTPSVLGAAGVAALLAGLASLLPNPPEEWTLELNPESTGESLLRACRDGGVTRLSVGVQSFHQAPRRLVHRLGEASLLPEKLALIAAYYGGAFSADLMAALPGQDESILREDIARLLSFKPAHVSLYALTREPGTPLAEEGRFKALLPPEEEADRLWLLGRDALEDAGYGQYEVSNFSLPGKESRHNIRYWRMQGWLGAGPAASGTIIDDQAGTGRRYTHRPDLDRYIGSSPRPPLPEEEGLDAFTLLEETLLMGFRYTQGPDEGLFKKRFGLGIGALLPKTIARWRERGLFEPRRIALTKDGLLLLDRFLLDALGEVDSG